MGKLSKAKQPESESEESEEEVEQIEEDEDESLVPRLPGEEEREMQERIVEDIIDLAKKAEGGERLTWNAIYSLKQKEIDLNEQMNQEIEKIKEKYELLKQPIYHKVSAASLGQRVEETLYKSEGLGVQIDPKETTPQKIEDFWGIVLDKEGLLTQKIDVDSITKMSFFQCELLCHNSNHMKISFKFSSETQYFSNMELEVQSKYDSEKNEPIRIFKESLKYKKEKVDHSLFTLLFDESTDIHQFYNVACELYQDYSNSLYYYFREEDQEEEENVIHEQEEEHDEDEAEDDDDEVEEVKPKKKVKKDEAPLEKPECKNQ